MDLPEQEQEAAEKRTTRGWWLGIFFIFLVSVLWAGGSILVQYIAHDIGFDQPFVFTYIGSGVMATCLPAYLGCSVLGLAHNPPVRDEAGDAGELGYRELEEVGGSDDSESRVLEGGDGEEAEEETQRFDRRLVSGDSSSAVNGGPDRAGVVSATSVVVARSTSAARPRMKSHLFMVKVGLSLSLVWYFAQWSYVVSLASTSVTSSTIISNSSALFTYLFNVLAATERITPLKTAGVALALLGAMAVGFGDGEESDSSESLWGDASALASAIAYGVYSTILRVRAPSDDEVSMSLVLGYMGVANVLFFLPLLIGLGLAPGVRILDGLSFHVIQLVVFKSVLDNLFAELLWARAILLTTPTVATVGCSLTIPIAFLSDFVLHGKVPNPLTIVGALMVVGGFYFVSVRGSGASVGASVGANGSGGGSNGTRCRITPPPPPAAAATASCCTRRNRRRVKSGVSSSPSSVCACSSCSPAPRAEGNNGHVE